MVARETIITILLFVGPRLLPRITAFYRSIRHPPPNVVRSLPLRARRSLDLLFLSATLSLLSTLAYFMPENVFAITHSRLQTQTSVIFTRLASLRPNQTLTPDDLTLQSLLTTKDARLIYLAYGADALKSCVFCELKSPTSYFLYALPSLLARHAWHLLAIGLATSAFLGGTEATRWRTAATIAGVGLTSSELYYVYKYDITTNLQSTSSSDLVCLFQRVHIFRALSIAGIDLVLAAGLYLTATNRMMAAPQSAAEKLEMSTRTVEGLQNKLSSLAALRNALARDRHFREGFEQYWAKEGTVMGEIYEDREVVQSMNAVQERMGAVGLAGLEQQAGDVAGGILGGIDGLSVSGELPAVPG